MAGGYYHGTLLLGTRDNPRFISYTVSMYDSASEFQVSEVSSTFVVRHRYARERGMQAYRQ